MSKFLNDYVDALNTQRNANPFTENIKIITSLLYENLSDFYKENYTGNSLWSDTEKLHCISKKFKIILKIL